jgi:PqqD family protein of HPr-rel-A system
MDTARLAELAISDTGFVFDPTTGHTYNLNATALVLLRALKAGAPMEAALAELGASFDVEPGHDVGRDVEEFVSRLREHGLIK